MFDKVNSRNRPSSRRRLFFWNIVYVSASDVCLCVCVRVRVFVHAAETLKDRKQELGILNPKKAYNICKYEIDIWYIYTSLLAAVFLGLETEIETWTKWTRVHSSLETMVSRSHHWLHQFQLVTEHSLKDGTNYGNRATGVGTKHAVLRPRLRPWTSGLETETETWTKWTRVHSSLETMVSRSQHWLAGA